MMILCSREVHKKIKKEDSRMNARELEEVIKWLAEVDLEELPVLEQMKVIMALTKMLEEIKPVMVKQKFNSDGGTFFWKM